MRADLRGLQRWMQQAIVAEKRLEGARRIIRPSATLEPGERLDIYRRMYEARLIDALRADYPGLAAWLGERVFAELAGLYIEAYPSRSYTLNRLGDRFPDFIAEVEGLRRAALVQEVARLELMETEVFDEQEPAPGEFPSFAGLAEEDLARIRFQTAPALRLGSFRYPAHRLIAAVRAGRPAPRMEIRPTMLAVYRRDYQVQRMVLSPNAAALLQALAAGETLGAAMEQAAAMSPAAVFRHFGNWRGAGILQGIVLPA